VLLLLISDGSKIYIVIAESKIAPPDEAWRKVDRNFEWNPEQLKVEINKFKLPEELNIPYTKILLLGPVGSGKSSFFNTINSVYRGHVTGQAPMGTGKHSVTTKVRIIMQCTNSPIMVSAQTIIRKNRCTQSYSASWPVETTTNTTILCVSGCPDRSTPFVYLCTIHVCLIVIACLQ
jgi:hypothetical protein